MTTAANISDTFSIKGKKILVVDDSPMARAMCGSLLEEAGYQVAYATEALEGIQMALDKPFDLILLDIIMPSVTGIEACQKIKEDERLRDIPVMIATAAEESEHLEKAFEAGAMDYITKPMRKFELLARLKSALMLKAREFELIRKNQELQMAFKEIKVLQGFLPVCAWCKKVRDLKGSWHQMEAYIEKHSLAKMSHGICETCMKKQEHHIQ